MGPLLGKPGPHSAGAAPAAALAAAALKAAPRHLLPCYLLLQHNRVLSVHTSSLRPEAAMASAADHIPALVQRLPALALMNLTRAADADSLQRCQAVAAAGGIPALGRLLCSSSDEAVQRAAAGTLSNLMVDSLEMQQAIMAAGAIPALLQLTRSSSSECALTETDGALLNLNFQSPSISQQIAAADGVPALARCLSSDSEAVQLRAVCALVNLCKNAHADIAAAIHAEAVPSLLRLLFSFNAEVRDTSGHALRVLSAMEAAAAAECAAAPAANVLDAPAAEPAADAAPRKQLPHPPRVCAAPGCGATRGLRRCGGCGAVRYCREACRNTHWYTHRPECRWLQAEAAAAGNEAPAAQL